MNQPSEPSKHESITSLLEARIEQGMYLQGTIPGERSLADELGVSYLTIRRATKHLVDHGLLIRLSNGRLAAKSLKNRGKHGPQIGLLVSMFPGRTMTEWVGELNRAVNAQHGSLRLISYTDEADPRIFEALDAELDGLFIIYRYEPSLLLKNQLIKNSKRLVSLWFDMAHLGIPSVESGPPRFMTKIIEHLKDLGHTRIDYLNTAPNDTVSRDRIYYWKQALDHYGLAGELFSKPDYNLGGMGLNARQFAHDLYNDGKLKQCTAMVCGTTEMAMGFQRGCHEVGLTVGKDISVTGFGEIYTAQLCNPSITTIRPGPKRPLLEQGLEWITTRGKDWNRPMQITSLDVDLFIGESTAPPSTR